MIFAQNRPLKQNTINENEINSRSDLIKYVAWMLRYHLIALLVSAFVMMTALTSQPTPYSVTTTTSPDQSESVYQQGLTWVEIESTRGVFVTNRAEKNLVAMESKMRE